MNENEETVFEEPEFNIDELIDRPLNELTEAEAEFVLNWKLEQKLKGEEYKRKYEQIQEELRITAEAEHQKAQAAIENLNELKAQALAFYELQV